MLERRLEEAALNAWPALQQILYDGWILRFSRGYSKRANSVTPLYESRLDPGEKVIACEQRYQEKGLPPIFRLISFAALPELEPLLERRGYEVVEPSLVLRRELRETLASPAGVELREVPLDEWLALYAAWSGLPAERRSTRRAMLEVIPTRRLLLSLAETEDPVACGMGVLEGDLFGIFDLMVAPAQRSRGYGTTLTQGMLAWAQVYGARHAYLQVVESNAPARRVYEKLGFAEAYRYHYRVLRALTPRPPLPQAGVGVPSEARARRG